MSDSVVFSSGHLVVISDFNRIPLNNTIPAPSLVGIALLDRSPLSRHAKCNAKADNADDRSQTVLRSICPWTSNLWRISYASTVSYRLYKLK